MGNYIVIPSNNILPSTILFKLVVKTWYNETSNELFSIKKSANPQPSALLNGPILYSNENKNKLISIELDISFKECLNNSNIFGYSSTWDVSTSIQTPLYTTLDTIKYNKLKEYLNTKNDSDIINIDTSLFMQPGITYIFESKILCNKFYDCDLSKFHSMDFNFADINCQISGGNNLNFINVKPSFFSNYLINLNGYEFTFDPDEINILNKNHLLFSWQCLNITSNYPCNNLLTSINSSINNIDINPYILPLSSYQYQFTLSVSDKTNPLRNTCTKSITITISTTNNNNTNTINYLVISITPIGIINNEINHENELRLLGKIQNILNINETDRNFEFIWTENTGQLTNIDDKKKSIDNINNFVLKKKFIK